MKHINKKNMNSKNKSKCKNKCKSKCKSKKHKSLNEKLSRMTIERDKDRLALEKEKVN